MALCISATNLIGASQSAIIFRKVRQKDMALFKRYGIM